MAPEPSPSHDSARSGIRLRYQILILLAGAIVTLAVGAGGATWVALNDARSEMGRQSRRILADQTETYIEKLVRGQVASLDGQLRTARFAANFGAVHLADSMGHHAIDEVDLAALLSTLFMGVDFSAAAYFVTQSGDLRSYPPAGPEADPAEVADYARSAAVGGEAGAKGVQPTGWTDVHPSPLIGRYEQVVDAVAPTYTGAGLAGYTGVSVSLTRLIAELNQHPPIRGGYTFILNDRRHLVAAPPHARLELLRPEQYQGRGTVDLREAGEPAFQDLMARMALGETAVSRLPLPGGDRYVAYSPLRTLPWRLGLVIPVEMATAASADLVAVVDRGTREVLGRMVFWTGCLLAASLLAGLILSRRIVSPIRELAEAAREIERGNLTPPRRRRGRGGEEIATLGRAFDRMAERIRETVDDLNRQNEQLAAESSRRRQALDQLAESEARFRSLAEGSPDVIFTLDGFGALTYLNPAFETILGGRREDALTRPFTSLIHPKGGDAEGWKTLLARVRDAGETVRDVEVTVTHADGTPRQLSVSCAPNRIGTDAAEGLVGIMKDVTEQRKTEARLQTALKMEAVGTLAGGLAHDFNNLLTGVLGHVSLMRLNVGDDSPHTDRLDRIEKAVESGAELTRQLLGFARGGKYEVQPVEINRLVRETVAMFARTRKEVAIHQSFGEDVGAVEADRGQIEQVLLNLFINAWNAMPDGGTLFLATENLTLDEDVTGPHGIAPGPFVKVSVTDTGSGIEQAHLEKIFEPFFTTRPRGRGTGLGLASAYGIVKNHGGLITVYSETGRGSTFNIYLPASDRRAEAMAAPPPVPAKGSGTVLLVDDEAMIREIGRDLLTELGYEVITAESGAEAVERFRDHRDRIHLVILDMIMPEMGGGETFDRLREIDPTVSVLLASGYSENGQAAEILERGCRGFIQKPFSLRQLAEKVAQAGGAV
jgi:two-component system, cell cycle sensor histidine kinase and response regulator CckA